MDTSIIRCRKYFYKVFKLALWSRLCVVSDVKLIKLIKIPLLFFIYIYISIVKSGILDFRNLLKLRITLPFLNDCKFLTNSTFYHKNLCIKLVKVTFTRTDDKFKIRYEIRSCFSLQTSKRYLFGSDNWPKCIKLLYYVIILMVLLGASHPYSRTKRYIYFHFYLRFNLTKRWR